MSTDTLESATITDAERVAEEQAAAALATARRAVKETVRVLAPIARSPLFGNGLHRGLVQATETADGLDDALSNLEKALHDHFHGSEEQ